MRGRPQSAAARKPSFINGNFMREEREVRNESRPQFAAARKPSPAYGLRGRAYRQGQDLRDYRIFRVLPSRLWLANAHPQSFGRDCRLWRKAEFGRKRNPENPANPVNPDSDKSRAARRLWRKAEFGRTRNPENPENSRQSRLWRRRAEPAANGQIRQIHAATALTRRKSAHGLSRKVIQSLGELIFARKCAPCQQMTV